MKPRKKVVVYCSDADEAGRIAFMMETRIRVQAVPICRFAEVARHPDALLVVIVCLARTRVDYQPRVDEYCNCETLVWHPRLGAKVSEFIEAAAAMLVQKSGPAPKDQRVRRHAYVPVLPSFTHTEIPTEA